MEEAGRTATLDDIDLALIDALQRNARSTYGELGERVGLSPPAAKRRVDRLVEQRVVRGFTVLLDHDQLGHPLQAFTELRFAGDVRVDDIAAIGEAIPEVVGVFTMAGDPDALAWLRVRDVHDLKRVVDRIRGTGNIIGTKTMIVLAGPHVPDR